MVTSSPAKAGEIDGVQILGYMDGVRVVRRLKKKLDVDVEYFYKGQGLGEDGACAAQSLSAQLDSYHGSGEDASKWNGCGCLGMLLSLFNYVNEIMH